MRIEIEIPKEFESDYNGDMFKDFFLRVLLDIKEERCLCGSYEIETAEMFLKAFDESKKAYDIESVVAELEKAKGHYGYYGTEECEYVPYETAIDIVRNAGKDGAE